jgi:hypothetical protein
VTVGFDPVGLAEFLARVVFSDVFNCFHIFSQRSFVQEGSPASGSISFRESATAQALLWTDSVECWVLVIFVGPFSLLTSSHPSPAQLPKALKPWSIIKLKLAQGILRIVGSQGYSFFDGQTSGAKVCITRIVGVASRRCPSELNQKWPKAGCSFSLW